MITKQLFWVDLFKKRYWQGLEPQVWKDRSLYLTLTITICTILHKLGSDTTPSFCFTNCGQQLK